jgi:endoribonuclease Nob1
VEPKKKEPVLIYDTSAFIGGMDPQAIQIPQWTTPENVEEVHSKSAKGILQMALKTGRMKLRSPSQASINKVKEVSKKTGDYTNLSEIDLKVIALSLDFQNENWQAILMTDDYSMQNIAAALNIEYKAVTEAGIRSQLRWKLVCIGCGKEWKEEADKNLKKCDICGTKLKRKSY